MGVFKNDVGRPTNKSIMIRNILKAVILLIIVGGALALGYHLRGNESKKENIKTTKKETSNGWYTPSGTAKSIKIYGNTYKSDQYADEHISLRLTEHEEYDNINKLNYKYLNEYKCTSSDCVLFSADSYDLETLVIRDKDFIVYNFKTNKAKKIDFGKYSDKVNYLYNEKMPCDLGTFCISSRVAGDKTYYSIESIADVPGITLAGLIGQDFKPIFSATDEDVNAQDYWENTYNYATFLDNGNVMYIKGNKYYTYNVKTGDITSSKAYKSVELISKGYIVVIDNDSYLKVLDLSGKEKAKLTKYTKDMFIHAPLSGWYEQDKKAGIYVVVQDPSVKYDDLSDKLKSEISPGEGLDLGYEWYYIPKTGETGKIATYIGGYAKPVLYLYPTKDNTKVTVSFEKANLLTTTYPKYKKAWEVTANKNGDLHDKDGKYYYGLYWEESGSTKVDFKEGFYVTKENAIKFLEDKLSVIGLNDKERNEFIMYWLPILEKNGKNLVYFELTESREKYNKLNINPKPDSLLRIAIHVKKVNKKTNIKKQKLKTFERKGFTAVEWGGVIH